MAQRMWMKTERRTEGTRAAVVLFIQTLWGDKYTLEKLKSEWRKYESFACETETWAQWIQSMSLSVSASILKPSRLENNLTFHSSSCFLNHGCFLDTHTHIEQQCKKEVELKHSQSEDDRKEAKKNYPSITVRKKVTVNEGTCRQRERARENRKKRNDNRA